MSTPSSPKEAYLALIDDTLAYLKGMLPPQKSEAAAPQELPNLPISASPEPKKKSPAPPPLKKVPPPQLKETPLARISHQTLGKLGTSVQSFSRAGEKCGLAAESFPLTPLPIPHPEPYTEIGHLLNTLFPKLSLYKHPPEDSVAKRVREGWRAKTSAPVVAILLSDSSFRSFFANLSKALTLSYGKAKVIYTHSVKQEDKWDLFLEAPQLRLVIAPDATLLETKPLLRHYRELPQEKKRFLGSIPLLLLPDPSLYMKDPLLKRSLWHLIEKALA